MGVLGQGSDLACNGSVLPNHCAYQSETEATLLCLFMDACRTVTVFSEGLEGLAGRVAVLSSATLLQPLTFFGPDIYSYTRNSYAPLRSFLAYNTTVLLPTAKEARAATAVNTSWLGCIFANQSVAAGKVVAVGSANQQPDAEACCRACQAFFDSSTGVMCNGGMQLPPLPVAPVPSTAKKLLPKAAAAKECHFFGLNWYLPDDYLRILLPPEAWNWCGQAGGCTVATPDVSLQLGYRDCELRWQATMDEGWPTIVLATGPQARVLGQRPAGTAQLPLQYCFPPPTHTHTHA